MTATAIETVDLRCRFGNQIRLKCKGCTRFLRETLLTGRIECRCGEIYFASGNGLWERRVKVA